MNFVFLSPHFPPRFYLFCRGLRKNGVRVLGIADTPYDQLSDDLKASMDDYYCVSDLSNYNEKVKALGYFISKYGRIDFIESNNEFWLESDAWLRTDFNINTGPKSEDIKFFKSKLKMKEDYQKAGIKVARYIEPLDEEVTREFAHKVGYPFVIKPDSGVGAVKTFKVNNDDELSNFFRHKDGTRYIMEEFIDGQLISFDGICNDKCEIVYPTNHVFLTPIMDIVNEARDVEYYTNKDIPQDLADAGARVLKAFGAKSRFYHLEFFRLNNDKEGLGKKGDLIGLEVNMRVPGGMTTDMINFAYDIDCYQIWADVIAFNENRQDINRNKKYCVYIGRRNYVAYVHNYEDISKKYSEHIKMAQGMPDALSLAMGNYFFIAVFDTLDEVTEFRKYTTERVK